MDGTDAVFVTPHNVGKTRVDLFPVDAEGCQIQVELKDAEGNVVAETVTDAYAHTHVLLDVQQPHLWNGLEDPYCYSCTATILCDGQAQDAVTVTYGYRSFHVSPIDGFYLNGKRMSLHGVARHQDRLDKGWAISKADHEEDIAIIKELGANTIRLAHYQHDQYFYELCNRAGFVLWAEIPFISQFIPGQEAYDNTISQMTELVAQNYNHPAICFWGISNEILIGADREDLRQNLRDLHELAKSMDPSRLTTMAQVSMTPMDSEHNYITDVVSYNHYFGWYGGEVEENGPWFDKFHAMHPDKPFGVSEYGAENILSWHTAEPENHDYTEEYANYYHQEMLKTFATRPFLWATHQWNCFDFAADARNEGGVQGRNNKGLVTYDRKTKKDAYYIYKAWWNPEPMVYVSGCRFVNRAPGERDVIVYTNCDQVTLVVNGVEVATKKAEDHMIVFENAVVDGENIVTAYAGEVKSNEVKFNGVAEHDYSYDLPEGNQGANWFDDPKLVEMKKAFKYPKDAFSIKDKMGALMDHPEASKLLNNLLQAHMGSNAFVASMGVSPELMTFMRNMRLNDALKMAGDSVSMEMKLQLNLALNQIKK